jgi:hypothetical protein
MGGSGAYASALVLVQKLFLSIRPELVKSALILAGHLLQHVRVPDTDVEMLLRNALRFPFDPTWTSARWSAPAKPSTPQPPPIRHPQI